MFQMLYVSAATELLSDADLDDILSKSRRNNTRDDVTGMLLYADGSFLQVLEGEETAIRQVYERISRDPRHHRIVEVAQQTIDQRDFPDWSMGFRRERNLDSLPPAYFRLTHDQLDQVAARECSHIVMAMLKSFAQVNLNG